LLSGRGARSLLRDRLLGTGNDDRIAKKSEMLCAIKAGSFRHL